MTAAQLRMQKDMLELHLGSSTEMTFPNGIDDIMNLNVTLRPEEGYWAGGQFDFSFRVPNEYPMKPPKVLCETQIYHPNIDAQGNVCLNILREDWKPVLNINHVVYGLQFIFIEPNPDDPLNKEAAKVLHENKQLFAQNVTKSLRGGYVDGVHFPRQT